jgi:hypothetical protein
MKKNNSFVTKKERQEILRNLAISRSPIKKRNQKIKIPRLSALPNNHPFCLEGVSLVLELMTDLTVFSPLKKALLLGGPAFKKMKAELK